MTRKLLFGLTLILALASMYAGLFGWPRVQMTLLVAVLIAAAFALRARSDETGH